jgi:hypothetical protein
MSREVVVLGKNRSELGTAHTRAVRGAITFTDRRPPHDPGMRLLRTRRPHLNGPPFSLAAQVR